MSSFSGKKKFFKNEKFNGKCFKCNKFGHQARYCHVKVAHSTKDKSFISMADSNNNKKSINSNKIIFKLDSGASDHLTNEK